MLIQTMLEKVYKDKDLIATHALKNLTQRYEHSSLLQTLARVEVEIELMIDNTRIFLCKPYHLSDPKQQNQYNKNIKFVNKIIKEYENAK